MTMAKLTLVDESLSSAFMAGYGIEGLDVLGEKTKKWVDGAIQVGAKAIAKAQEVLKKGKELFDKGKKFFTEWMAEDPLGATAAAGAVLLAGVVIVSVGASIVAAGGIMAAAAGLATSVGSAVVGGLAGLLTLKGLVLGALGLTGGAIAMKLGNSFVQARQFLSNFNWQITDEQLDKQFENQIDGWFSVLGSALGRTLGNVVCGGVAGALVMKFNPRAANHIRTELGEEIYEEVMAAVWGLLESSKRVVQGWLFKNAFKNGRRIIKWAVRNSYLLQGILGEGRTQTILNWGNPDNDPWTFTETWETNLENIPNTRFRNLATNLSEEFFDSCDEAILVATGAASSYAYP